MATLTDYESLVSTLKQDIDSGDVGAMRLLGDTYYQGISGIEKNIVAAFPYWKMAADHGDVCCSREIGLCYIHGKGCMVDGVKGVAYLTFAADHGDASAQEALGIAYETGLGVTANNYTAMQYYRMAALQNQAHAQGRLGFLQYVTKGCEYRDEWLHWLCCAGMNGNEEAKAILNDIQGLDAGTIEWKVKQIRENGIIPQENGSSGSRGCYIATAVYGSYDCPEVWTLRRFRDYYLAVSWVGCLFIKVYYTVSPALVKIFGKRSWFRYFWKNILDKMVHILNEKGYKNSPYEDKLY